MDNRIYEMSDEDFKSLIRNTFNRNKDKVWLNSIWKLIDPHEI